MESEKAKSEKWKRGNYGGTQRKKLRIGKLSTELKKE